MLGAIDVKFGVTSALREVFGLGAVTSPSAQPRPSSNKTQHNFGDIYIGDTYRDLVGQPPAAQRVGAIERTSARVSTPVRSARRCQPGA